MPLGNILNTNIKRSCGFYCMLTADLHIRGPRKFSMQTPRLISRGIYRLFECIYGEEGVAKRELTMHDCDKV